MNTNFEQNTGSHLNDCRFLLTNGITLNNGVVTGDVLDYYEPRDCFAEAVDLELTAQPGLAFTCVEDYGIGEETWLLIYFVVLLIFYMQALYCYA